MKKKFFLMCVMIVALICMFTISAFADEIIVSKTENDEYGTIIQLSADPGLDNAKQYVSTLNKINDAGTDKDALCILTDGTYFYVFPSSYVVDEIKDGKNDGRFNVYTGTDSLPGIVQALNEFNTAMGTSYYAGYTTSGSGGGKKIDAIVRFVFPTDVTFIHKDYCCMRSYSKLVEVRFNHAMDFSRAGNAFQSSSKLKTVVGFEKTDGTALDKAIFMGCSSLESIKLPTNIVRIPSSMFWGCSKIKIDNLSECTSLTIIGDCAFRDSNSLVFTLPDTVTTIENEAFRAALKGGGSFTINETSNLQVIGSNAFTDCRQLGPSLYIPSSVTSIGTGAFTQTHGLQELVNFENCQITELAADTFKSATKLKSIKIPETVTTIGSAFVGTEKLALVYIPKTATVVGEMFSGNQSANAVYIFTGNDTSVFASCNRLVNANVIPFNQYSSGTNYTGVNLVVGYSHCVAYNNSVHGQSAVDKINEVNYFSVITVDYKCSICDMGVSTKQIDPLFTCIGYSIPENGRKQITIGYTVNNAAITDYTLITGKTVKYGVFAVAKNNFTADEIFAADGTVAENVINVEFESKYAGFEFKITGFNDNQTDIKLAMGAYTVTTDGDSTEYSYLQNTAIGDKEGNYYFVSYNDILSFYANIENV